jgi:hypothetical protein
VHRNGDELGEIGFATDVWRPGDVIPIGERSLRVVEVEWNPEGAELLRTLIVEVA